MQLLTYKEFIRRTQFSEEEAWEVTPLAGTSLKCVESLVFQV